MNASMTEQVYADLAASCDRLLRAEGTGVARLAIPALHVVNEHPGSLRQYRAALEAAEDCASDGMPWFAFTDRPRAWLRHRLGSVRTGNTHDTNSSQHDHPEQLDVLMVSHLSNPAQLQGSDDFYFGHLQQLLQDRGCSQLRVLLNHAGDIARARMQPVSGPRGLAWMLLPGRLSRQTERRIWQACSKESQALRRMSRQWARTPLEQALARLASRQSLAAQTLSNLRAYEAVAELCRRRRPRIVITTYEGDAVERLIWAAARSAGAKTLCVGYQHTRLLERAHAIRRPVAVPGLACDPDVVLTSGPVPQATLAASPELREVRLIPFGSHRRQTRGTLPAVQNRPRRCLVLPDADEQECQLLFDFAFAGARCDPDTHFILRPHPGIERPAGILLRCLPPNASISTGLPLQHELAQARYCLYRSSSAVVQAVLAGIKPFYLARPGELSIDPLYATPQWRATVSSPTQLKQQIDAAETSDLTTASQRAGHYYQQYLSPVRPAAIDELLELVKP